MPSISFANEGLKDPRIQVKLDKHLKYKKNIYDLGFRFYLIVFNGIKGLVGVLYGKAEEPS